ncbi:MAG: LuxR family transcriptional regulator [Eggerthella lenta]
MEHRRGIVNACGAASAAGLSLILLWCTLMGHTPGFLLSSLGLAEWVNARTFWLTGILVVAAVLTAAPRWVAAHEGSLAFVMPVMAAVGTGCFALSFHQDFFSPTILATCGLVLAGLGYFWFASRFVILLATTQGFACVVWCIVAAFPLRQLMSLALDGFIDPAQQVVVAIALPCLAAACFEAPARRARGSGAPRGGAEPATGRPRLPARPAVPSRARGSARRRATWWRCSSSWACCWRWCASSPRACGATRTPPTSTRSGASPPSRCLPCAWRRSRGSPCCSWRSSPRRALPAAHPRGHRALFVVVVRAQLGDVPSVLLDSIVQLNDPFAHLLFWSAVAAAYAAAAAREPHRRHRGARVRRGLGGVGGVPARQRRGGDGRHPRGGGARDEPLVAGLARARPRTGRAAADDAAADGPPTTRPAA